MQTTEQRLERLEKHNRRLTAALTMTVVAMCAVVTVAATGDKIGRFDTVVTKDLVAEGMVTRTIVVMNAEQKPAVSLGANDYGNGLVVTYQPNGKELVRLTESDNGGVIEVYNKTGEGIVQMGADEYGNGLVGAYNRKGMGRTLQPGP